MNLSFSLQLASVCLVLFTGASSHAGEAPTSPAQSWTVSGPRAFAGWEVRGGALVSTWGPERWEPNLNAEIVAPKFYSLSGWADAFIPRLHAGAVGNLAGGTSYGYAGPLWTVNYDRYFGEFFLGAAVHNGQIQGHYTDASRNKLGCRVLYHVGWSGGYHINENWSAMVTFDHISNGSGTLSNCGKNEGASVLGLRFGYQF